MTAEVTVLYRAYITHVPTGKKAVYEDKFTNDTWGECIQAMRWAWTEGNYGCDCNRSLFFERSLPEGKSPHYRKTMKRRVAKGCLRSRTWRPSAGSLFSLIRSVRDGL